MKFEIWHIWMLLAGLFLIGELFRLRSFFLWLSFSAALSGILSLLEIPAAGQVAVFINMSGIMIVLERRFNERYTFRKPLLNTEFFPQIENLSLDTHSENVSFIFRKSGPGWEIKYGEQSYTVKPTIGLFHIRNLIIKQGEWIHCSELKKLSADDMYEFKYGPYKSMSHEQLENENLRVKEDIHPEDIIHHLPLNKLKQLRNELIERKEADNFDSPDEKIDQLDLLEFIEKYLNSITDKKGKSRKLHDETETDRKAVSAAINRCRKSLIEDKDLYIHLVSFVHAEGNSFRYLPDRPIHWQTS